VLWAIIADDQFGGEPVAVVSADMHVVAAKPPTMPGSTPSPLAQPQQTAQGPDAAAPVQGQGQSSAGAQGNTTTITIIDGKTGEHHDVVVPGPANRAVSAEIPAVDPKFIEMTPHGPVPRVAADGTRPADAFARPVQPLPGRPDAPRIALIIGGLGVSASATADAIAKLPEAVTLGFVPYGSDVAALATRARMSGHEILLQVPMEPFDYPDNDPGPQTLLTTLTPQQSIDRLYAVMGKIQGYVGMTNTMGARFTASEDAFSPILHETAKRGLIYVDDGASAAPLAALPVPEACPSFTPTWCSMPYPPPRRSTARSTGWKWRRGSGASPSGFRQRCRSRSSISLPGPRAPRAAACFSFR
jgi:uncharacterized protein